MPRTQQVSHTVAALIVAGSVAFAAAACGGDEPEPAAATMTTETPVQNVNLPIVVKGCLRAGEAASTYVITAARTAESDQTATYHIAGANGRDLQSHVGQLVEITGVEQARQEIASRTTTDPAPNATGTRGETPAVSTQTKLTVKHLEVRDIRRVDGDCEMQ